MRGNGVAFAQKVERVRIDDAVPEVAAGGEIRNAGGDLRAQFFQQREEFTVLGTDLPFEFLTQPRGERGGRAVGRDRNGQIALPAYRAEGKAAVVRVIDGVAEDVAFFAEAEDLGVIGQGGDDEEAIGEIGGIASGLVFDAGAGGEESLDLEWDLRMISDNEAFLAGEIEKNRILKIHYLLF